MKGVTTFFSSSVILILIISCHNKGGEMPGMVSYTFRESFSKDLELTLDTIKSFGITDIEFSSLFGRNASDIKEALDNRGMRCSSYGVNYNALKTDIEQIAKNADTLGAEYIRVAWIPHEKPFTLDDAKMAVEVFNHVGKVLYDAYRLKFCYHNHGYEFSNYSEQLTLMDYIIQHTDPKYVNFEVDILWVSFPGYDPAALIKKYPERIKLIHLKDLKNGVKGDFSGKTPKENDVALGQGQIDIPSVIEAGKSAGIKHYYIEDESPNYINQIPASIKYLNSIGF